MARFQLLPDTGHSPQQETPDQVIHAIWDSADTEFSAFALTRHQPTMESTGITTIVPAVALGERSHRHPFGKIFIFFRTTGGSFLRSTALSRRGPRAKRFRQEYAAIVRIGARRHRALARISRGILQAIVNRKVRT